ncbi:MAG: hypothetical protein Q7S22_04605 [Candidatus Micrarchaeota archaeon]|nr:hypothetical protein [Candidatus Micrarchaeota archaeon]
MSRLKATFVDGSKVIGRAIAYQFRKAKLLSIPDGHSELIYVEVAPGLLRGEKHTETSPERLRAEHDVTLSRTTLDNSLGEFRSEWQKPTLLARALDHLENVTLKNSPKTRAILFELPRYVIALNRLTWATHKTEVLDSTNLVGRRQAERHFVRVKVAQSAWDAALANFQRVSKDLRDTWNEAKPQVTVSTI